MFKQSSTDKLFPDSSEKFVETYGNKIFLGALNADWLRFCRTIILAKQKLFLFQFYIANSERNHYLQLRSKIKKHKILQKISLLFTRKVAYESKTKQNFTSDLVLKIQISLTITEIRVVIKYVTCNIFSSCSTFRHLRDTYEKEHRVLNINYEIRLKCYFITESQQGIRMK